MTSPSFYTDTTGRTASRREIADIGGAVRLRPGVILMPDDFGVSLSGVPTPPRRRVSILTPEEGMARIIESLGRSA